MASDDASPLPVNAPIRCPRCRYDLRGTASPVCPECGAPKSCTKIAFFNDEEFDEAARVLKEAGISILCVDSTSGHRGLGSFYSGYTNRPEIWFGQQDLKKVVTTLDNAGVATPLPIVDRSEPNCPSCSAALDMNSDEICPACGAVFQWVEIEDAPFDPSGSYCQTCRYDLTGRFGSVSRT